MFKELTLRRRRAHEYAAANTREARLVTLVRPSDFEAYLQRRLGKSTVRIETHVVTHGCQA